MDVLFTLSVQDATCFNSFPSAQSLMQVDAALPILVFSSMDFLLFIRSLAQLDLLPFPTSSFRLASSFSALDAAHMNLSVSVHSTVRPGLSPFLWSFICLDVSSSLHGCCHMGSAMSLVGLTRVDSVSLLLVIENMQLESFLLLQAFA